MKTSTPQSVKVQLSRLFGAASAEATAVDRTPAQWKKTMRKVLRELFLYVKENLSTDEVHWLMICSSFAAAEEALKQEEFWPGYAEALVRLSLLLLGDYPDHKRRSAGKKKENHYKLNRLRTLRIDQDPDQRVRLLFAAKLFGAPKLSTSPQDALSRFRATTEGSGSYREFMLWYKREYPEDYAALF